jgi:hypothetical protein
MYDRTNGPIARTGYIITTDTSAPSASGQVAIWNQSGTGLAITSPGATTTALGRYVATIPAVLASCLSGQVVARLSPDHAARALSLDYVGAQAPGNSGSAVFQLGIGGTSASGGVLTLTAGNVSGFARVSATAITGANATVSGEFTLTCTNTNSGAFAGGQGAFYLKLAPPV